MSGDNQTKNSHEDQRSQVIFENDTKSSIDVHLKVDGHEVVGGQKNEAPGVKCDPNETGIVNHDVKQGDLVQVKEVGELGKQDGKGESSNGEVKGHGITSQPSDHQNHEQKPLEVLVQVKEPSEDTSQGNVHLTNGGNDEKIKGDGNSPTVIDNNGHNSEPTVLDDNNGDNNEVTVLDDNNNGDNNEVTVLEDNSNGEQPVAVVKVDTTTSKVEGEDNIGKGDFEKKKVQMITTN